MSGVAFRALLGLMIVAAAGTVVYFRYFRPPLSCADQRVVDTTRTIVKERLVEGKAADVMLHLIVTVATARDGVRCTATAQIQMGEGKDDDFRNIEYIAFVGKDYDLQPSDKRNFTVFANFKK